MRGVESTRELALPVGDLVTDEASETGETDAAKIARISVQKMASTGQGQPHAPQSALLSVTRVTLPTFEVVYRDAEGAYADAQTIRKNSAFELDRDLEEPPGSELVLELTLAEFHFTITLLFRVIGSGGGKTALEWWARRNTDPKLLDLWIESLESHRTQGRMGQQAPETDRAAAVHEAMEIYRRMLSSNPFDVLGVHWTSSSELVAEAKRSVLSDLDTRLSAPTSDEQVVRYLVPCKERVTQACDVLSSLDGRRAVRAKMVPPRELENARKQAEYILQLANRDGQASAILNAQSMLAEVSIQTTT